MSNALCSEINYLLGPMVQKVFIKAFEVNLHIDNNDIVKVLTILRDKLSFQQLIDICGVDYPQSDPRFMVVYHLLSLSKNYRLRIKTATSGYVPSVIEVYPNANWYEREAYDMYGIQFSSHPDLRRLLSDYEFEGFPLRKDFPLTGYIEVSYDNEKKEIVKKPIELMQAYREFDFQSPWKGE